MIEVSPHFREVEPPTACVDEDADTSADDAIFSSDIADPPEPQEETEAADDLDHDVHVGFEPVLSPRGAEPRKKHWLTLAAWAGSLAAHAAIATAAVFLARELTLKPPLTPPRFQFALGDTEETHGVRNHQGADALPGVVDAAGSAIAPHAGASAIEPEPEQPTIAAQPPPPPTMALEPEPEPVTENGALPIVPPEAQAKVSDLPFYANKLNLPSDAPAANASDATAAAASSTDAATSASAVMNGDGKGAGHSPVASIAGQNGATTGDGGTAVTGVPGIRAGLRNGRKLITPTYPLACRQAGEEGIVRLLVDVRADGTVGNIAVVDDAGHPRLAQAAVRSLEGFVFDPAMDENGHPVPDSVPIPYSFRLQNARR